MQRRNRKASFLLAASALAGLYNMSNPAGAATRFLDVNGTTAGFGTPTSGATFTQTGSFWTTDATGVATPVAQPTGDNIQIGNTVSDFSGANFTINMDLGASMTGSNATSGFTIVSNNVIVTMAGTANTRFNSHPFQWSVPSGSQLIVTNTGLGGGWNFNSQACTLAGGGIIDFKDTFGSNENNASGITINMSGGAVKLEQTATSSYGNSAGGLTLTNGTLQLVSAASFADTFSAFVAGVKFNINGGVIDNLSGAANTINLGSGAYSIGGDFTFTGSNDMSLGANSVTLTGNRQITVNGSNLTVGPIAASTFSLTKAGAGTLTLSGSNQYTGATNINNGVLAVTGSIAGNVVFNNTSTSPTLVGTGNGSTTGLVGNVTLPANIGANIAHINPGIGANAFGTLTMNSLTVNGGDLHADLLNTTAGNFDFIKVLGTATFAQASTISPSLGAFAGTYTFLSAGTLVGTVLPTIVNPTTALTPRPTTYSDAFVGNTLQLTLVGGPASLVWNGQNGNAWDNSSGTQNWKQNGVDDRYYDLDVVKFDDTAQTFSVNLNATVTPNATSSVIVANSAGNDYTFSGTGGIAGTTGLTKNGGATSAGALILATNNTYTGLTTINAGTLQLGAGTTTGSIVTDITNNGTLVFNRSNAINFSKAISGTGGVYQSGSGALTLNSNTYSGETHINSGSAVVTTSASLGAIAANAGTVTVAGTATYHFDTNTVSNDVPGGQLDLSGNTTSNNLNFGAKPFKISGAGPDGSGAIVNNSAAQQQNAFQSVTLLGDAVVGGSQRFDIRGGTPVLDLQGHTLVKSGAGQFSLVGATVTAGNIVLSSGTLGLEANAIVADGATPGANGAIYLNGGTLEFFNDANGTITRPIIVGGSGAKLGNNSSTNSIVGSGIQLTSNVEFTQVGSTGTLTLTGNITEDSTPRTITKTGATLILLSGSNSFSGGLNLSAGTIQLGSANALNSSGANSVSFTNAVGTTAGLRLNGNNATISGLTTGATPGPAFVENGLNNATLTVNVAGANTYAGVLQDSAGTLNVVKGGAGMLTLTGANTHSGLTTVSGGTLALSTSSSNNNIPNSSVVIGGAGTLDVTGVTSGFQVSSNQTIVNNGNVFGAVTANNGTISGAGGVYNNGIVIGGGGTLTAGATAGHGTGALTTASLTSNGTLLFEVGGASSDQINVTGNANLAGGGIAFSVISAPTVPFYDVMTYGSLTGAPNLLTPTLGRITFTLDPSPPANTIRYDVSGAPTSLTWDNSVGAGDGQTWSSTQSASTKNWNSSSTFGDPNQFYDFDTVTFDDTNPNSNPNHYNVNINGTVTPTNVLVNNNSDTFSFSGGTIAGAGVLTKSGSGALSISSNDTFSGGVVLSSGTLNVNSGSALGTGTVTVNNGTLNFNSGASIGALVINGGTLDAPNGGQTLGSNNPIILNADVNFIGNNDLNLGNGTVTLADNRAFNIGSHSFTLGGPVVGSFGITKNGVGTLVLSGTSTYTGNTTISAGAIKIAASSSLGSTAGVVTISGADTFNLSTNTVTVTSPGGQVDLSGNGTANALNFGTKLFKISGAGPDGSGAIFNNGVAQQNAFEQVQLTDDAVINASQRIDLRNGGPVLDLQGHTLVKIGGGQFTLVGATATAGSIVSTAGELGLEGNAVIADGATPGANGTITLNAGSLEFFNDPNGTITRPIVIGGNVQVGNNSATNSVIGSAFLLKSDVQFTQFAGGGTLGLTGNISEDSTPRKITKTNGTGTNDLIVLSGSNTFSGGLEINAGTIQLGSAFAAGIGSVNFTGNGGTGTLATGLRLNGNSVTIGGVAGNNAGLVNNTSATPVTLTLNDNQDYSYDGVIADGTGGGALALLKTGANKQTLTGSNTYTGTTTVNGGTLEIGGGGNTGTIAATSAIGGTSNGTVSFNRNDTLTVTNAIGGAVNVVKNNGNLLTYSGTSTSSGVVSVNGGTLSVTGSMATNSVQINGGGTLTGTGSVGATTLNGGTLQAGVTAADGSIGTLTLASFNSTGGNIRMDVIPATATADRLTVTGAANFTNTTTFYPIFSSPPTAAGSIPLLTASSLTIAPNGITASNPQGSTRLAYHVAQVGNEIDLVIDSAFGNILWNSNSSNVWDLQNTPNWKNLSTNLQDTYFDLDLVSFDSTASVRNLDLEQQVDPSQVTVNDATTYTVTGGGGFNGNNGFVKAGNGTFVVGTTNNSYTGNTSVLNGTLKQGSTSALPNNGTIVLGDATANTSGTYDLGGFDVTVGSIGVAGTGNANVVTNSGATTATVNYNLNGKSGSLAAVLKDGGVNTGTLALSVSNGTLVIASNNTYTGNTTIAGGATLQLGAGTTTGSITSTNINDGGTLILNRSDNFTFAANISGGGTFTKSGAGIVTIGNSNSYTANTIINGGTLAITASNNIGDVTSGNNNIQMGGGGALQLNSNVDLGNRNVTLTTGGGILDVSGTNTGTIGGNLSGAGAFTKAGTGKLLLTGNNSGYTNFAKIIGGTLEIANVNELPNGTMFFNGGTLRVTGDTAVPTGPGNRFTTNVAAADGGVATATGTFDVVSGVTLTLGEKDASTAILRTAGLSGGVASTGSFHKTGTGTMAILTAQNNQLDSPFYLDQGTLICVGETSGGSTHSGTGGSDSNTNYVNMMNGTTMIWRRDDANTNFYTPMNFAQAGTMNILLDRESQGSNVSIANVQTAASGFATQWVDGVTVNVMAGANVTGGTASWTVGTVAYNGNGTWNVSSNASAVPMTMFINGTISGSGGMTKAGDGTLVLNGSNTFTGSTTLASGFLVLGNSAALANSTLVYTAGVLDLGTQTAVSLGGLTGTQNLNFTNDNATPVALTIGNAAGGSYSGNLTGITSLTKVGTGSQTFSGALSYAGTTSVKAGKLVLQGDGAASPVLTGGGADITGGQLVFDYTTAGGTNPKTTVLNTLAAGYGQATKFSTGALRTSATPDNSKGLGWVDNGSNVSVMYTYYGDSNLDGQVTTGDFVTLATGFNNSGVWGGGDFNYDGVVNALDFNALASNFGKPQLASPALSALPGSALGALVPEPGSLALLAIGAGSMMARRRRR